MTFARTWFGMAMRMALGSIFAAVGIPLLYLIEPFRRLRLIELREDRIGHLAHDTELFARKLDRDGRPAATSFVFFAWNPANRQLLDMWKRRLCIVENVWLRRAYVGARPVLKKTRFYRRLPDWTDGDAHELLSRGKPALSFTAEEERRGRAFLESMAIGPNDWFVCAHVRDSSYMSHRTGFGGVAAARNYQDSRLDDYYEAMRFVRGKGGFVLRMGAIVEQPLPELDPGIIDYATKHRTEFLDIYLSARCRFFLGSNSGLVSLAQIFNVPLACANIFPYFVVVAGAKTLFTPKLIRKRHDGSICSLSELREMKLLQEPHRVRELRDLRTYEALGLDVVDNDAADVLDLTKEMLDLVEGREIPEEGRHLQDLYRSYFAGSEASPHAGRVGYHFLIRHRALVEPTARPTAMAS